MPLTDAQKEANAAKRREAKQRKQAVASLRARADETPSSSDVDIEMANIAALEEYEEAEKRRRKEERERRKREKEQAAREKEREAVRERERVRDEAARLAREKDEAARRRRERTPATSDSDDSESSTNSPPRKRARGTDEARMKKLEDGLASLQTKVDTKFDQILAAISGSRQGGTTGAGASSQVGAVTPVMMGELPIVLSKRFSWVRDTTWLDKAGKGMLRPSELGMFLKTTGPMKRMKGPEKKTFRMSMGGGVHIDDAEEDQKSVFTADMRRFDSFAIAWNSYMLCMVARADTVEIAGRIASACAWHLDHIAELNRDFKWAAVMEYHYAIMEKRVCEHGFRAAEWEDVLDTMAFTMFLNDTSRRKDGKEEGPAAGDKGGPAGDKEICRAWNGARDGCAAQCKKKRKHACLKCGGAHRAVDCGKGR